MEYQVEDLSPVKKKVNVKVPAEEVDAALATTIALYRKDVKIDGFRKGKVPDSVIESRFRKQIYREATNELLNYQLNYILSELSLTPLSRIDMDSEELTKGEEHNYSFSFEVLPEVSLPEYNSLKAEEEEVEVKEEHIEEVIDRIRKNMAELVVVNEDRAPVDGEIATIDFAAYKDGELIENAQANNFELTLGEGQALEAFENAVKKIMPGQTIEEEVFLPEDFINDELAGQTVNMKITLNVIKNRVLPEIDDDLAQKAGGFDTAEKMREGIYNSYKENREQVAKSEAQKKILDQITEQVEIALPDSMVETQIDSMLEDFQNRMEKRGKSLESTGKTKEQLREDFRNEAESLVKAHIVLLAIASNEGMEVTPQEIDQYLYKVALQTGQDIKSLKEHYEKNNMMFALRDKLLADKAMDFVYDQAEIEKVPAQELKKSESSDTEDTQGESVAETP
jgi:trigger factor